MALSAPKRLVPPPPPADFARIDLATVSPPQRDWVRLSPSRFKSPLFFSRNGAYRFDSDTAKWGVCCLAQDVATGFMEVFADRIRKKRLDYAELQDCAVWRISVPRDLSLLHLAGPTLPKIRATLQCFVSRYSLSQEWGHAFMEHPAALDGVIYTGRQSGLSCIALFGDSEPAKGRGHQRALKPVNLGRLTDWEKFLPLLNRTGARVWNLPARPPTKMWR